MSWKGERSTLKLSVSAETEWRVLFSASEVDLLLSLSFVSVDNNNLTILDIVCCFSMASKKLKAETTELFNVLKKLFEDPEKSITLQLNEQPKFMEISRITGGLKQSAIMLCKVFLAAGGIFEKGDVIFSAVRTPTELTREHVGFNLLREKVKELQREDLHQLFVNGELCGKSRYHQGYEKHLSETSSDAVSSSKVSSLEKSICDKEKLISELEKKLKLQEPFVEYVKKVTSLPVPNLIDA